MSLTLALENEELHKQFFALQTPRDIARLLDIEYNRLVYHLYKVPPSKQYTTFQIPKKSGGVREISTPAMALKIIQRKLNQVLQCVYAPKAPVRGFVHSQSVVTNARTHSGRKYVFNIDLRDFFPSINFGRVRGMFIAAPYKLDPAVATVLAQICCFNKRLPQGAPTSPIISNMICSRMDSELRRLAQRHRCDYTRYADDITFSTSMPHFPSALAKISEITKQLEVGDELGQVISKNGFEVNPKKVRLETRYRRQEVTGLTTNVFPNVRRQYVRQIRSMLHAWEKFGLEAAEQRFFACYNNKHRRPQPGKPAFRQVVKGKIEYLGMVRGKDNLIYLQLIDRFMKLNPEYALSREPKQTSVTTNIYIITEAKTVWKHLKAALLKQQAQGCFKELHIEFMEYEDDPPMGSTMLLGYCKHYSQQITDRTTICIFDNDDPEVTKEVSGREKTYRDWGNGVFSFAFPIPVHRNVGDQNLQTDIEFYYEDSDIMREDSHGKRLYLSNEFDKESGKHVQIEGLNCTEFDKIRHPPTIIDRKVFDKKNKDVALAKNDFANYVLNGTDGFQNLDGSKFQPIFDIIRNIAEESKRQMMQSMTDESDTNEHLVYPQVFLCHAKEDKPIIREFYRKLGTGGFKPWMDEFDIIAGSDWKLEIKRAIRNSQFFLAFLSKNSVDKKGYVQKEIREALDILDEIPEGRIFLIPVRLDDCEVPDRLSDRQWVDMFEPDGLHKLLRALRQSVGDKRT